MAAAGDERLGRANQRRDSEVARRLEETETGGVEPRPGEDAGPPPDGALGVAPAESVDAGPACPEPPGEREESTQAVEMHVEQDNADELIEALAREGGIGPPDTSSGTRRESVV